MAVPAVALAKAVAMSLSSEKGRKAIGWVVAAVLSPVILLVAFFCSLGSGAADHNRSAVELCFYGGTVPAGVPAEYRACIEEMRNALTQLDTVTSQVGSLIEGENGLDAIRIKAIFYALYFGRQIRPVRISKNSPTALSPMRNGPRRSLPKMKTGPPRKPRRPIPLLCRSQTSCRSMKISVLSPEAK